MNAISDFAYRLAEGPAGAWRAVEGTQLEQYEARLNNFRTAVSVSGAATYLFFSRLAPHIPFLKEITKACAARVPAFISDPISRHSHLFQLLLLPVNGGIFVLKTSSDTAESAIYEAVRGRFPVAALYATLALAGLYTFHHFNHLMPSVTDDIYRMIYGPAPREDNHGHGGGASLEEAERQIRGLNGRFQDQQKAFNNLKHSAQLIQRRCDSLEAQCVTAQAVNEDLQKQLDTALKAHQELEEEWGETIKERDLWQSRAMEQAQKANQLLVKLEGVIN